METIIIPAEVEVSSKAQRRRFTAKYKQRILAEADACTERGELGALLRREGLYSSHLAAWRTARRQNGAQGLEPKKRGARPRPAAARESERRVAALEKQLRRMTERAEKAEALVDLQKNHRGHRPTC